MCQYMCIRAVGIPSAPIDFTVTDVTSSSIEVSWSPPANSGGEYYILAVLMYWYIVS